MDASFESGAGPTELFILRRLSAYKDELIRRLHAKVRYLRKRLEALESTAVHSPRGSVKGTATSISTTPRAQTSSGLVTPVRCNPNTGGLTPPPLHSVCRSGPSLHAGSLNLRIPPEAVMKKHNIRICSDGTPALPQTSRGPNPGGTGLLDPRTPMKFAGTTKLHLHTNSNHMNASSSRASCPTFGSASSVRAAVASVSGTHYSSVPQPRIQQSNDFPVQPRIQESKDFSKGHLRCVDSVKQTPRISIPPAGIIRPQKLTTIDAHRLAACSSYGDGRSPLMKQQTVNSVLLNKPPRVSAHVLNEVQLQTCKRNHERVSILSSGSTCSSVSSRRRPWD